MSRACWRVPHPEHSRWQARQEDTALLSGPRHFKKLKLNDGIASLCVCKKTGSSLDEFPLSMVFLLKDKSEAKATRSPCRAGDIIKCQCGIRCQHLLSLEEGLSMSNVPKEVVPGTEERTEGSEC